MVPDRMKASSLVVASAAATVVPPVLASFASVLKNIRKGTVRADLFTFFNNNIISSY